MGRERGCTGGEKGTEGITSRSHVPRPPNLALQRTPATGRAFSSSQLGGPWPGPLSFVVRQPRISTMRSTTRTALASLISATFVLCTVVMADAQKPQFKPGDRVTVGPESVDLRVGTEVVAKLARGQTLTVQAVKGQWVSCSL